MFESNEAVRGRLISHKPWDRIDIIFGTPNGAAVTAMADLGCQILKFVLNHVLVWMRPGMAVKCEFTK